MLERAAYEVGVGVECADPNDSALVEASRLEGGSHGMGVKRERTRNGADTPVLCVEEATDLSALGFGDHDPCALRGSRACPLFDTGADETGGLGMAAHATEQAGLVDG